MTPEQRREQAEKGDNRIAAKYEWETCLFKTDEWTQMLARRQGWAMVGASVSGEVAYIFWLQDEKASKHEGGVMEEKTDVPKLADVLDDARVKVCIGLEQQGHILTVEKMLAEGKTWEEIGEVIGWYGPTAEEWYGLYLKAREESQAPPAIDKEFEGMATDEAYQREAIKLAGGGEAAEWEQNKVAIASSDASIRTSSAQDGTASKDALSLAADGLAEVLRWLDRRGGLGYDAHEEIQKRVAAYEKAKESR